MRNNCRQTNHPVYWKLLFGLALALMVFSAVPADQESRVSRNGLFRFHAMTAQDIETMQRIVGIRVPGVNYNTIVDGFGTGYAPPTEEEYDLMLGNLNIVDGLTQSAPREFPAAIDLSTDPRFPKVDTQGSQGSCAAWATTYYAYGYSQARHFDWTEASLGNPAHLMSPAWTYNKANPGSDLGSSDTTNAWVIRDWGCATWETMPYDDDDFISWGDEAAFRDAMNYYPGEIFEYSTSTDPDPQQKIEMVKSILDSGSVATLFVWASFYGDGVYDDYILTAAEMDWENTSGAHLNAIVGYDDSISAGGEVGAFRVVNSWGDGFADGGYYWMTYDAYLTWEHSHRWFGDPAHSETTLLAVWQFSEPGSRDGNLIVYNGDDTDDIRFDNSDFVNPWASGGDHPYPPFMCCSIDGMIDAWALTDYFYLYMEYADLPSTVSSFYLEYYDQQYTVNQPVDVSDYCAETPATETFAIGLQYPYRDFPTVPSDPDPENETVKVPVDTALSWNCTDPEGDSLSYDIYLDTSPDPALAVSSHQSESYDPGALSYDTAYYWRIVASDGNGHTAEGPVWSFITEIDEPDLPPDVPSNPFPVDGELLANTSLELSWESEDPNYYDIVTFDVYFGAAGQMELVADDISENNFAVSGLEPDRYYEWKIIAFDDTGLSSEGPVWTFKTKTEEELIILTVNAGYRQGNKFIFSDYVGVFIDLVHVGYTDEQYFIDEPGTYAIGVNKYLMVGNAVYEFDRWLEVTKKDNPITIEILDDVTLTAKYRRAKEIIWVLP